MSVTRPETIVIDAPVFGGPCSKSVLSQKAQKLGDAGQRQQAKRNTNRQNALTASDATGLSLHPFRATTSPKASPAPERRRFMSYLTPARGSRRSAWRFLCAQYVGPFSRALADALFLAKKHQTTARDRTQQQRNWQHPMDDRK
ncbi:IS1478 transposase [Anopheles sinensis]|uniref:IS1478 transposase n=1 Tax=Anopheles sinensis TaxID=74873 RepID=A0A084WP20_ANOSI|nr:IS1478 transposase [Anopheles sinensis]